MKREEILKYVNVFLRGTAKDRLARECLRLLEDNYMLRNEIDHLRETAWVEKCLELECKIRKLEAKLNDQS